MRLIALHPEVAWRDCAHCEKWHYNEKTGAIEQRRGKPLPRRGPTPCRTSTGCAKGTPESPKTLTPRNRKVLAHYYECKATNTWPDDSIVRRNAAVLYQTEQRIAQIEHMKMLQQLLSVSRI